MTNEDRKEFEELMDQVEEIRVKAENSKDKEELERLLTVVTSYLDKLDDEIKNPAEDSKEYNESLDELRGLLIETQLIIISTQEDLKGIKPESKEKALKTVKNGVKLGFISSWFKDQALKAKEHFAKEEDFLDDDYEYEEEDKANLRKRILIGTGTVLLAGALLGGCAIIKHNSNKKASQIQVETEQDEIVTQPQPVEETLTEEPVEEFNKEEELLALAESIKNDFNSFEGLNVSTEETLALLIHLNVGNSYMTDNKLALDRITLNNMIKKYYIGLEEGTEEFESYVITDADLARVSSYTQELRNELVNYVIVLNDQGKYDESKAVIETLEQFITDETLQDEARTLTENVMSMQSSSIEEIKRGAYRWYNYIFAGPKTDVRNFDDYGYLYDGDSKEMTFENQEMTMRFYTWFLDTFVDIQISGKNIIPQDIINSKEVKLMDQANIMRALGYKNCTSWPYTTVDFDNALENQGSRSNRTSNSGRTSSSSSSSISHATNNDVIDAQINQNLEQNSTVGSTSTLPDGSTMTVIESGERETTVVITPDPTSEVITDTTPQGPSTRTEVETGGGNETIEEIHFEEDPTEVIIEQGGEVIYSTTSYSYEETYEETTESTETIEEIHFEDESSLETSSIRDEIEFLNSIKAAFQMSYPNMSITFEEDNFQKTLSC